MIGYFKECSKPVNGIHNIVIYITDNDKMGMLPVDIIDRN